jgi:hypothetical protein
MNPGVRTILKLHVLLVAAATSTAVLTAPAAAPSLLLGGAVMGANFWLLAAIARRALGGTRQRPGGWVAVLVLVKFSSFIGLLGLLMRRAPVEPVSFGFGASLLLVACVVGAFGMRPALARG